MAKNELITTTNLARHYSIFEHMFQGKEFTPSVRMRVKFGETDQVHYGNFLLSSQVWGTLVFFSSYTARALVSGHPQDAKKVSR